MNTEIIKNFVDRVFEEYDTSSKTPLEKNLSDIFYGIKKPKEIDFMVVKILPKYDHPSKENEKQFKYLFNLEIVSENETRLQNIVEKSKSFSRKRYIKNKCNEIELFNFVSNFYDDNPQYIKNKDYIYAKTQLTHYDEPMEYLSNSIFAMRREYCLPNLMFTVYPPSKTKNIIFNMYFPYNLKKCKENDNFKIDILSLEKHYINGNEKKFSEILKNIFDFYMATSKI